ncbi:DegV family protein [Aerococcus sp. 1KP-2016]|uniref:DegV family protein n=1 Tax=Aerococcus sp. 1KP-2016 TaxID=1981982 RepID=UPI000B99C332|nr:DegV family protein [Aerococcus sp. 1KP-2016]OYQ65757.1 EDD domain protein [Aerococcus sp. 1KP-2016]
MKSAILVDSTSTIPEELQQHPDIYQVTLKITFKDGEVMEDTTEEKEVKYFYNKMVNDATLPLTSQPEPADYYQIMDEIVAKGYDEVYGVFLSSALSGTFQTARMILQEYEDRIKVHLVDTKAVSIIIGHEIKELVRLLEAGYISEEILPAMDQMIKESEIYLFVDDLNNLVKGGRTKAASAFIGSMLKIYPVLYFDKDGTVVLHEKIRTENKIKKSWMKIYQEAREKYGDRLHLGFAHGDAYDKAVEFRDFFLETYPEEDILIRYLTPVVGVHGGKGALGMGFLVDADLK